MQEGFLTVNPHLKAQFSSLLQLASAAANANKPVSGVNTIPRAESDPAVTRETRIKKGFTVPPTGDVTLTS